ncbi:MAG: ABC transporter ATP-binding protein [Planctomycetaceae bacterium]|jgi:ATP-binding cassette, subfamily B, bacterial|nr:ABC transporter ATP-binding protein [Planctomycetaceae bacterium]
MPHAIKSSREQFDQYKEDLFQSDPNSRAGGKQTRERSSRELLKSFWVMSRPHRPSIFLFLATLSIATVLALIPPAATKFVVDSVLGDQPLPSWWPKSLPQEPWPLLVTIIAGVLIISIVRALLAIWGRWHATRVTKLMQMSVRKDVFSHAMRLPLHRVQDLKSGGATSILRQDAGSVGELVFGLLYNPWRAIIQLSGSLIILAWVDWTLLLGAMVLVPVVYITHRTWISRIRPQHRRVRAQREMVDSLATESFSGIRVVRAFGRQRSETTRILRGNHLMGRQELFAWWWSRWIELAWETLIPFASAALMVYGGWQVLQSQLTLGDLVMFLAYLLMLLGPLAVLAQSAAQFQNSLSGLDRVLDLLEEDREMDDPNTIKLEHNQVQGKITMEDVSFRYPNADQDALTAIDLQIGAGETIALVGPSGAGKTTFCNLVARFYDPTEGRILLDDRDLKTIDVENYRQLIGVVEQDVFLFDGSITDNIGYGNRQSSMKEIRHAAKVANADEFIEELPEAYDTVIGERGVKLSGGQRQRLAIARAILADPKILILDEATSNLDTESERLIQSALKTLIANRTCFVIAHRLSTITHASRILVIDDGRILECGTHSELMEHNGRYREMVQLQTSPEPVI